MNIQELYEQTVRHLSPTERLRLAKLILDDIAAESVVDCSEEWTDEDFQDFAAATWTHAEFSPLELEPPSGELHQCCMKRNESSS